MTLPNDPQIGDPGHTTAHKTIKELLDARITTADASATYVPAVIAAGAGIDPTGVADSTAAVQALIDSVPLGGRLHFPAGRFLLGALSTPNELTISGSGQSISVQPQFGDGAQFFNAANIGGTVLRFTNTTGASITAPPLTQIHVQDLAMIGPGSGTSRGLQVGTTQGVNGTFVSNVLIGNFAVGLYGFGLFNSAITGLHVVGCDIGLDLLTCNGNAWTGLVVETCATHAIRLSAGSTGNLFAAGVVQGNAGTVVHISDAAQSNNFVSTYFENSTAVYCFDILAGASHNKIDNAHISGSAANGRRVRTRAAATYILMPQAIGEVDAVGAPGIYIGQFSDGLLLSVNDSSSVVINTAAVGNEVRLGDRSLQIGTGRRLRLQHNGDANFIERDANTGNTRIGGSLALTGQGLNAAAPAAGAAGATPATPATYLTVEVNGVNRRIALY